MPNPDRLVADPFEPRRGSLLAALVFLVPVIALCWPIVNGYFLGGTHSDQYVAGYAFRSFGAEYFKAYGSIPQWNPYLFGGMPFIAASSGDIFYPTAWLRWIMPVGAAMALGFAVHLFLSGFFAFAFFRSLRAGWAGAVVGGLAYQLSGIVASMVHPGHDGKLFVSALAPLLLLALTTAIRDRRSWAYGLIAIVVGLSILTPHPQMTYYLLVAAAIWTIYLVFFDPDRPAELRWPVALASAAGAVLLGVGIAAIFVLPFLSYFPYSPRVVGASGSSWEYATSYPFAPQELLSTILPEFSGRAPDAYFGPNFFKLHSEYLGAVVIALAAIGAGAYRRQRGLLVLAGIGILFLLVSFGGHSPFYRLWYEVMPYMKKVRAPGMAFFLVSLTVSAFAAFGADRIVRREASSRAVMLAFGVLAAIGLLGAVGALQPLSESFTDPRLIDRAVQNAPALVSGGVRLLAVALLAGGAAWAVASGRVAGAAAAGLLAIAVAGDLVSVVRRFFVFEARTEVLFAQDSITGFLAGQPRPFRVFDLPSQSIAQAPSVYPGSYLMAHRIPVAFGYHGNEVRYYDEVWGGKNIYQNLQSWNLWQLWAINYLILATDQPIPGFHRTIGPVPTTPGGTASLYVRDTLVPYARVVPGAVEVPEEQIIPTLLDQRFPYTLLALYPDSSSLAPRPIREALPAATSLTASVSDWRAGAMTVALKGNDTRPTYLLVAETWYPDWRATVDGRPATVHRANYAQLSVELPPGAREVRFEFRSAASSTGRAITFGSVLVALALVAVPIARRRTSARPVE